MNNVSPLGIGADDAWELNDYALLDDVLPAPAGLLNADNAGQKSVRGEFSKP